MMCVRDRRWGKEIRMLTSCKAYSQHRKFWFYSKYKITRHWTVTDSEQLGLSLQNNTLMALWRLKQRHARWKDSGRPVQGLLDRNDGLPCQWGSHAIKYHHTTGILKQACSQGVSTQGGVCVCVYIQRAGYHLIRKCFWLLAYSQYPGSSNKWRLIPSKYL